MAQAGALAKLDLDSIVDRIAAGAFQSHIARELGVAPQSLHAHITKHPGYRDALKLRNMAKLDDAQEGIANPETDLARATQEFKAAAWRAERECPEEWGNKSQVAISGTITLDMILSEVQAAIDAERVEDAEIIAPLEKQALA